MDLLLNGKMAFISGATSGIGFAVARILLEEGAQVIINGRSRGSVHAALERLQKLVPEGDVDGIPADFANEEEVHHLMERLPDIDILVNNVGIYSAQSFFDTSDEEWYRHYTVNVMSGVRLSRHVMPGMLERNWGRILFVSSECATLVPNDLIAYSMTKVAILTVSRGLAQLTKGTGVTVNSVLPGSTMTEGAEQFLEGVALREDKSKDQVEKDFFENVRTSSLLGRFASVGEVANTLVYLASPLSAATNGSSIKVDGGSMGGIL